MIWITFVGEGRSGHTVVSGILGSHPHIRMSEEQKYISKWCRGYRKTRIIDELLAAGPGRTRRDMGFPNLCHHTDPLMALGDKCGWDAVNEVRKRSQSPTILTRFSEFMEMPVKVIHTSRHPLDNISAWLMSPKYQRMHPDTDRLHNKMIRRYCQFYETAEEIMEGQDVFHLRNEELIADPSGTIQALSDWLGLPTDRAWRRASAKFINAKPNRRSQTYPWIENYREQVLGSRVLERFPSLEYYAHPNQI